MNLREAETGVGGQVLPGGDTFLFKETEKADSTDHGGVIGGVRGMRDKQRVISKLRCRTTAELGVCTYAADDCH